MTKDKIFSWKFCLCCGLFFWFVLNLLQGFFTEIQEDEAYYALYGEHLAWGYFDHPPMVGLTTFLSSKLFSGILGVRFITILASCLSLFVMWLIATGRPFNKSRDLNPNNVLLYFIIACSVVMFNIYGFITTPDVGLILFSALFMLVYQRYLAKSTWPRALLMGALMACMIYSKYHAFLLLGLIVLSSPKLLKDGKFWTACLVAIALLLPHVFWQINADFPSFKYHLSQRSEPFRWSFFLEYLPNQLLVFNPFTFGAVVYVLIKHSPERATKTDVYGASSTENQTFERGLKFILLGFFFFFWLMAFRGHVEPHWTIVCVIPIVVLVYRKALIDEKLKKYTIRFITPSLLLIVTLRIAILTPLADSFGYHNKEAYYKAIETVAGDAPVVFRGSFQQPSLYHYFTGKESSTLRAFFDRKTQFDLWQFDTAWVGKPVFICGPVFQLSKTIEVDNQQIEGYLMQRFQSPNHLVTDFKILDLDDEKTMTIHHGDTLHIAYSIYNPSNKIFDFQHTEMETRISLLYQSNNNACHYNDTIRIGPHSSFSGTLFTVVGDNIPTGPNRLHLALGDRVCPFITDENHIDVIVAE